MIQERLSALREEMKKRKIDIYIVPTADFHESEYVGDHFKCRQFLTGFTGSAGIAVVTMKEACLWVDGRYFVQAAVQLQGTSVKMMKMGQEGVPSVAGYLEAEVPENGCLGFDGRVVNALTGIDLEKRLKEKNARILCSDDLVGEIWEDRPALSMEPAWALHEKYAGKTAEEKLKEMNIKINLFNLDNKKDELINYIKNNDISFVYSCGLIYFNKRILQLVDDINNEIKFAIPNNNLICCGEGICGACTVRLNNCRIKTCKAQMNGREFLSNLK